MKELEDKYTEFLEQVEDICNHISLRHDENGPFIFALGLNETHTLQMRKIKSEYVLELWHGKTAEVEKIITEPKFTNIEEAFSEAKNWLNRDAT